MKPGHTPDSTHGRAAEDCTSRWSGLRRLVAAALIAATAAGALVGCSGAQAGTDDGRHAAAEENSLPPGVMPPNDPPQPGDAPLGSDGHYDYSAPGFELKNPCDTEYFQRALELGWRVPDFGVTRQDEADAADCTLINETSGIALTTYYRSIEELERSGYTISVISAQPFDLITIKGDSLFGESCFTGAETPYGIFGATLVTGGFSQHNTMEKACTETVNTIIPIIGG